ncbi:Prenylcysteine lyase-domain-containing protein [Mycotypha africana]|uniref:Prenylcysteine lyase-domain-containing protein n=1 Tax=Mycotypha africana TaxID=64632 RepID=UPI0023011BEF|nr:Prenylcysteine lyase-domain-containing protein [Mycotypha africana]KAI8979473.1 Prenylcysteine lyase-domain-containing protein [Mycotypha africana]
MSSSTKVNPHRPYYIPGNHHHNYTCISSTNADTVIVDEINQHAQLKNITTHYTSFALLKYFTTMLTSPFDVGTTLLQVQYAPHEDVEVLGLSHQYFTSNSQFSGSLSHIDLNSDSEEDGDFYSRPQNGQRTSLDSARHRIDNSPVSVYDAENRPIYQMAPLKGGGVLQILTSIVRQPTEGWTSLFKGQTVTWIYEISKTLLRSALESTLNDMFGLYDDTIPLLQLDNVTPNIATLVVSHIIVGLLLSPLEIVKTRLIVQSAAPSCKKYNGLFHALRDLFKEEGGITGVYLYSKNLIPTIFHHTLTPLISCSTPLLVSRMLKVSPADSPLLYSVADLAISTVGLIVMLPLETIRKRLQCQLPRERLKTTVAIRPQPYNGVLEALYRILKEEGTRNKKRSNSNMAGPLKAKHKRKQKVPNRWMDGISTSASCSSNSSESDCDNRKDFKNKKKQHVVKTTSAWGIHGLYRGFTMQLTANIMSFVIQALNGLEGGGAAGTSTAFFLRNAFPTDRHQVSITIFDRNDYLGGRSTAVPIKGNQSLGMIELGASIFVEANTHLMKATKEFGLTLATITSIENDNDENVSISSDGRPDLGVWDGKQFLYEETGSYWDNLKALWRYGLTPLKFQSKQKEVVKKFMEIYDASEGFQDINQIVDKLNFKNLLNMTAESYLKELGINERFSQEILQTATRGNYCQDLNALHALAVMVSMEAGHGTWAVEGGNYRIFEEFAHRSQASLRLQTKVTAISNFTEIDFEGNSVSRYLVETADGSSEVFDEVVLATPILFSGIQFSFPTQSEQRHYHPVHVTLVAGHPNPSYFGRTMDKMPTFVITTGVPLVNHFENASAPFYTISVHRFLDNGESVIKIFSPKLLEEEFLDELFFNRSWTYHKGWHAFPKLRPIDVHRPFPSFKIGPDNYDDLIFSSNIIYTGAFENFISTMETQTIAGKNAARLLYEKWCGTPKGYPNRNCEGFGDGWGIYST